MAAKLTIKAWLEANMDKYDTYAKCRDACVKATKKDPSTVRKYMRKLGYSGGTEKKEGTQAPTPCTEDIIDKKTFLGRVDIVAQVLEYLDDVVKDVTIVFLPQPGDEQKRKVVEEVELHRRGIRIWPHYRSEMLSLIFDTETGEVVSEQVFHPVDTPFLKISCKLVQTKLEFR